MRLYLYCSRFGRGMLVSEVERDAHEHLRSSDLGHLTRAPPMAGFVTGFIEPCVGIGVPHGSTLPFAAGTVTVLRGVERLRPVGPGEQQVILPTVVVARQHVNKDQAFHFVLAPGRYVVVGIYDEPGAGRTLFDVTVPPRMTLHHNLPDLCK